MFIIPSTTHFSWELISLDSCNVISAYENYFLTSRVLRFVYLFTVCKWYRLSEYHTFGVTCSEQQTEHSVSQIVSSQRVTQKVTFPSERNISTWYYSHWCNVTEYGNGLVDAYSWVTLMVENTSISDTRNMIHRLCLSIISLSSEIRLKITFIAKLIIYLLQEIKV